MAKVPLEIVNVGIKKISNLSNIIDLLNKRQDAFYFSFINDDMAGAYRCGELGLLSTSEVYNVLFDFKKRVKGYHPHLIAIIDRRLDGKILTNLFSSFKMDSEKHNEGMAIFTLFGLPRILGRIPIEEYLLFELLSFAIRFLYGEGLIHNERRKCIFDKKTNKLDILDSMKQGQFCTNCKFILSQIIDEDQFIAIQNIFKIIRDVANSEDPLLVINTHIKSVQGHVPKVFLCHSSKDKDMVIRLATDLLGGGVQVWFDNWEIKVGENIVEKISSGIAESDYLAVVLSKSAVTSFWVQHEWTSMFMKAANEKKAKVLPILIEDCEIPTLLAPIRYANFKDDNLYNDSFRELLKSIRGA